MATRHVPASRPSGSAQHLQLALTRLGLGKAPNHAASEFDNFYAPENKDFYANYSYIPLSPRQHEVRLLKVFPHIQTYQEHLASQPRWGQSATVSGSAMYQGRENMIACELVEKVRLSRIHGRYIALSYVAEDPTQTVPVLVNGIVFNAFANLGHVMKSAISHWSPENPDTPILLWADQICINQSNPEERAVQAGMIREIYQYCDELLVCLSTQKTKGLPGFLWMERPQNANDTRGTTYNHLSTPSAAVPQSSTTADEVWNILWNRIFDDRFVNTWVKSFKCFHLSPWWTRCWAYQEFIVAPRVRFFFGNASVPWTLLDTLLDFSSRIETLLATWSNAIASEQAQRYIEQFQVQQDELDRKNPAMAAKLAKYQKANAEMHSELRNLSPPSVRHLKQFNPSFNEVEENYERARRDLEYSRDLTKYEEDRLRRELESLEAQRNAIIQATVERDKATVREEWKDKLDYPHSKTFTLKGLRVRFNRLRVLLNSSQLRAGITAILSVRDSRSAHRTPSDLKALLEHARMCATSDGRDRVYAFLGLAREGYGVEPDYDPRTTVVHVFIRTARGIIALDKNLAVLAHAAAARRDVACYLPTWVPDWTSPADGAVREAFERRVKAAGDPRPARGAFCAGKAVDWEAMFHEDAEDPTLVGLEVKGTLVGQFKAVPGQGRARTAAAGPEDSPVREFSIGASRLSVCAPRQAQEGDEIWVLGGGNWPVVLRRQREESNFSFLGEALVFGSNGNVSDIMFGVLGEHQVTSVKLF